MGDGESVDEALEDMALVAELDLIQHSILSSMIH